MKSIVELLHRLKNTEAAPSVRRFFLLQIVSKLWRILTG